ncbi:hypothetical protein CC1G_10786 [Coprinopsis cinerea okayama7|uniref:Uncharacterized protein n=1 Tax=Coprinopsis cinerea (strain Okayama-7 / 130 / ATCC MYA-4618 / FGSC 9003) TaxID=240176 RepID=A8NMG9_COPC7|nr:hypothetical protein CC1G_10786 [Coprinopsis cinerea okayama7\|eukprot:XP_001834912.2 hypothetical protein CC1G_10786 [Coprinopsis cinerea okayama7\
MSETPPGLQYIRDWNNRLLVIGFHFPPGPTQDEARRHTEELLRQELLRLPTSDEVNKAALVHSMFIWDYTEDNKCYRRNPKSLARISNVAHPPETVWEAWLNDVKRIRTSVDRFHLRLKGEIEAILASDEPLEDKWVQGLRLREAEGIPTRIPIQYGPDGRATEVKYPWLLDLVDDSALRVKKLIKEGLDELVRECEEGRDGDSEWETESSGEGA